MDNVDRGTRSRIMASIKSEGTGPERRLGACLDELGVWHGRLDALPGRPDFVVGGVAVFVHGCFWHGCKLHYREPKSNVRFWRRKMSANRRRDSRCARSLRKAGWRVAVVWEHEDPMRAARRVAAMARRPRSGSARCRSPS